MIYLFLDTNIFLHYRRFDEIDWCKELKSKDDYRFVIAPIVIQELDSQKSTGKKISQRAKEALSKIEKMINNSNDRIIIIHQKPNEQILLS